MPRGGAKPPLLGRPVQAPACRGRSADRAKKFGPRGFDRGDPDHEIKRSRAMSFATSSALVNSEKIAATVVVLRPISCNFRRRQPLRTPRFARTGHHLVGIGQGRTRHKDRTSYGDVIRKHPAVEWRDRCAVPRSAFRTRAICEIVASFKRWNSPPHTCSLQFVL
jgi:hypothetical protein